MADRQALERALANAQAAGDEGAVEVLTEALAAAPAASPADPLRKLGQAPAMAPSHGTDALRKLSRPKKTAREVLVREPPEDVGKKEVQSFDQEAQKVMGTADIIARLIEKIEQVDKTGIGAEKNVRGGKVPSPGIPGIGGPANVVGGALEETGNVPFLGPIAGVVTRPIGNLLRGTTKEGREIRQLMKDLEMMGANMRMKGTGQISDMERKMVKEAWGLDSTDMYADTNVRIGLKRAADEVKRKLADLQRVSPDAAAYLKSQGYSLEDIDARFAGIYDPTSPLPETDEGDRALLKKYGIEE